MSTKTPRVAALLLLALMHVPRAGSAQEITGGSPAAHDDGASQNGGAALPPLSTEHVWRRGLIISFAGQLATLGIFLALPPDVSLWPAAFSDEYWDSLGPNFRRAWTSPPVRDTDLPVINYLSHPYAGAFYHNAVRSRGAKPLQAFLFSVAESTLWEYVVEAPMEQPSIQDLIVTPVLGSAIGEVAHRITLVMRRNGFNGFERVAVTVLNPAYVLNNGYH